MKNDLFVEGAKEVKVPRADGSELTLFVHELGFTEIATIGAQIRAGNPDGLAKLIAASVRDDKGHAFTLDEARRLKRKVAEPLINAAVEVNGLDVPAKDTPEGN